MKKIFLLALLVAPQAFAGANNVDMICKSKDGLVIQGNVPGDLGTFDITVTKGQKSVRLFSGDSQDSEVSENATISIVESLKDGVWTLASRLIEDRSYGSVQIFALPKTVKYKDGSNSYNASFEGRAQLYFSELSQEWITAKMSCTLSYSI